MRLTLRKLHLLLSEWRMEQRLADRRAYNLICVWCKDPPDAGALFPLLADNTPAAASEDQSSDSAALDDDIIFQQVVGSLHAR